MAKRSKLKLQNNLQDCPKQGVKISKPGTLFSILRSIKERLTLQVFIAIVGLLLGFIYAYKQGVFDYKVVTLSIGDQVLEENLPYYIFYGIPKNAQKVYVAPFNIMFEYTCDKTIKNYTLTIQYPRGMSTITPYYVSNPEGTYQKNFSENYDYAKIRIPILNPGDRAVEIEDTIILQGNLFPGSHGDKSLREIYLTENNEIVIRINGEDYKNSSYIVNYHGAYCNSQDELIKIAGKYFEMLAFKTRSELPYWQYALNVIKGSIRKRKDVKLIFLNSAMSDNGTISTEEENIQFKNGMSRIYNLKLLFYFKNGLYKGIIVSPE